MNPPTMQEVDKELVELDQKIAALTQFVERKNLLVSYKAILERVCSNGNGTHTPVSTVSAPSSVVPVISTTQPTTDVGESEISNSPTVNTVRQVLLSSTKSMKVPDIVKAMLAQGWTGSGDQEKDRTTVYNALYNNMGTRFTRIRRGLWTVKK